MFFVRYISQYLHFIYLINDMNTTFSYNTNAKYSTKDLKGGHSNINFSLLDVYLDEKRPFVKIQLSDIFKDHHIVAKPSTTSVGYDE